MIDGKKVFKLLKDLASIAKKLQPDTAELYIHREQIYLIDESGTTGIIKSNRLELFPYPVLFNVDEFTEFMKDRKVGEYAGYEYNDTGSILKFKGVLYDTDGSTDKFILPATTSICNGTPNVKKKNCVDTFMKRLPEFSKLEELNDELKEIINNSHFPYLYNGYLVMKSLCPILNKAAKLYTYDLREYDIYKGYSSLVFRVEKDKMDIYTINAANLLMSLKFSNVKHF